MSGRPHGGSTVLVTWGREWWLFDIRKAPAEPRIRAVDQHT